MSDRMSNEEMVKEAVEEAKAKAAQEEAQAENASADGEADAESADSGKAETAEGAADGAETEGEDPDGAGEDDGDASKTEKKKLFGKKNKKDVAEESRFAYKDIDRVMEYQKDLVEPVRRLRTIGVVKG